MNQYIYIRLILDMLNDTIEFSTNPDIIQKLSEIRQELLRFLEHDIALKKIIDNLNLNQPGGFLRCNLPDYQPLTHFPGTKSCSFLFRLFQ